MKISMILGIPSLIILPVFPIFAADGAVEGEMSVSGLLADVSGSKAKFNEYRDSTNGVYTGAWVNYDTDEYFIKGKAVDVLFDTQRYEVEGGRYGSFRAYIDYYEIPHNFTFGAKTFYSGVGTNNLTITTAVPPEASWKNFDYATKRKAVESGFSFDHLKPFFFEVSVPHEEKTGIYPIGAASGGVASGFPMVELPQSINYTTNSVNMTTGFAKNPFFAAVSFYYSEFDNSDPAQFFARPILPGQGLFFPDAYSVPPGNDTYKIAFKGSSKLPYNSQFSVNAAKGGTKSDDNILLAPTPAFGPIFHGQVDTNNYDLVFITNPVHLLKAKIDYKYYERKNESDQITESGITNDLFGYQKNKFGVDLGWSLPAKFNLNTVYSNVQTTRDFGFDRLLPETKDNIYAAELKWKGLNFLTPKVRYELLQRTADHGAFDPADIEAFVFRYDTAPKDQNTIKASVEVNPLTNLNFTVGYKYVDVDYTDTVLGLKSTKSDQVNFDAGYTLGTIAQLNGYFDVELKKDSQFQRSFANNPDPRAQDAANFNWDVTSKDKSYSWGAGTEIYLIPENKLTLLLQYDNVKSNGNTDFNLFTGAGVLTRGLNNDTIDIANWDDYRLTTYSAKLRYKPAKQYTFIAGYVYERFRFQDAQFDNYLLQIPEDTGTNFLTGAYANPNYDAHVVFVTAIYKF